MRHQITQAAVAGLAVLALLLALNAEAQSSEPQAATVPQTVAKVTEDTPAEIRPVVSAVEAVELTLEDEETIRMEDERIEAALLEQGYYRTDIPLTYLEQDFLHTAADEFGVDYYIMVALIEKETNFRNITGDGGSSTGYCQIQERWWSDLMEEIGAEDLTQPYDNFRTAAAILSRHLERYGTMRDALTAYNAGKPGRSQYASDILANAEKWRETNE